ncbi:hypothetical protein ARMSODRAFT_1054932 [Armillaria solidipes]|uniref:Cytochrome P450 n=1 Tax=Armillaria solidipes TaxID=1076256 RepID=A0A2H3AZT9_9AGAR|nr:hypothetical protein ARMSODRAFT_1054932 [Armillaria solidipes]
MAAFFIVVASLLVASLLHWWFQRPSVKHVKGPPSPSFWLGKSSVNHLNTNMNSRTVLLGHERILRDQDNAGDLETKWRREYGTLYRIGGCLGVSKLDVFSLATMEVWA